MLDMMVGNWQELMVGKAMILWWQPGRPHAGFRMPEAIQIKDPNVPASIETAATSEKRQRTETKEDSLTSLAGYEV